MSACPIRPVSFEGWPKWHPYHVEMARGYMRLIASLVLLAVAVCPFPLRLGPSLATCSQGSSLTKSFNRRTRRPSERSNQCWRNIPGTRTNGRRGSKTFPSLTTTWCCLCRRQDGLMIFASGTGSTIGDLPFRKLSSLEPA